jgi:hypothetical protein
MSFDSLTLTQQLAELLHLPPNTQRAVLVLQAGDLPRMRVTTVLHKPEHMSVERLTQTFTLVPRSLVPAKAEPEEPTP